MRPGDPNDPLLRQVLPVQKETRKVRGYLADPVGDLPAERQPGLLHKYRGRALLLVTGACAIHCRYCFRRNYPYSDSVGIARIEEAIRTIAGDPSIDEVILSGGDPLTLRDARLADLAKQLVEIPHLRRLRVHSRLPVTIPARITPEFVHWLGGSRLEPVLVLHANHPRELTPELARALLPLRQAGVTLLNQAVLLRGVNDDSTILHGLSSALHGAGILPYYLHLLDRVEGAAHFSVPMATARRLMKSLRTTLPGYLVSCLVREIAGEAYKTPQA
jgi:EF-P beta-lysylation protein EpmB